MHSLNPFMDYSGRSANVFDKHAELYREKFSDLGAYQDSYANSVNCCPQMRGCWMRHAVPAMWRST